MIYVQKDSLWLLLGLKWGWGKSGNGGDLEGKPSCPGERWIKALKELEEKL